MKTAYSLAIGILLATNSSFAGSGIEGIWRLTGTSCSSGAPSKASSTDGMTLQMSGMMKIDSSQIQLQVDTQFKYTAAYLKSSREEFKNMSEQIAKFPEGPEKEKALSEFKKAQQTVEQYANGFSCSSNIVRSYSIDGSLIKTNPISSSGICKPSGIVTEPVQDTKSDISSFEVTGSTLRVTAQEENKTDQQNACPKGDKSITTFERVNVN